MAHRKSFERVRLVSRRINELVYAFLSFSFFFCCSSFICVECEYFLMLSATAVSMEIREAVRVAANPPPIHFYLDRISHPLPSRFFLFPFSFFFIFYPFLFESVSLALAAALCSICLFAVSCGAVGSPPATATITPAAATMLRSSTVTLLAPVFCRIIDSMRHEQPYARSGILYPIRVELGDGVVSCTPAELQDKLDVMLSRSQRYATVKTGQVYTRHNSIATTVTAYGQYVITGNMRGGYIKGDHRYGPRLTGYGGATTKPGLRWNGDDL